MSFSNLLLERVNQNEIQYSYLNQEIGIVGDKFNLQCKEHVYGGTSYFLGFVLVIVLQLQAKIQGLIFLNF